MKPSILTPNMRVFLALCRRDFMRLKEQLPHDIFDSFLQLFLQILILKIFFPLMGMPKSSIPSIYLGAFISTCVFLNFSHCLTIAFDLQYNRFIDYLITLPITKRWLFAQAVFYCMIRIMLTTIPTLLGGIILLGDTFTRTATSWSLFFIVYVLTYLFFASFFITLSYWYEFDWFMNNLWPRRLTILFGTGCLLFSWKQVYQFSPYIGIAILANPYTHITEGLRATLLGGNLYLAPIVTIPTLCLFTLGSIWLLSAGIKKRLDPV